MNFKFCVYEMVPQNGRNLCQALRYRRFGAVIKQTTPLQSCYTCLVSSRRIGTPEPIRCEHQTRHSI